MWSYAIRKLGATIPTLLGIIALGFILLQFQPGNPAAILAGTTDVGEGGIIQSPTQRKYQEQWTQKLGLNLPPFIISIYPAPVPDTLFEWIDPIEKKHLRRISITYSDSLPALHMYAQKLAVFRSVLYTYLDSASNYAQALQQFMAICNASTHNELMQNATEMAALKLPHTPPQWALTTYTQCLLSLIKTPKKGWNWPHVYWHSHNQFTRWLWGSGSEKGLLQGNWGTSYTTQESVMDRIQKRIGWTLFFSISGLVLSMCISIPLGVWMASKPDSPWVQRAQKVVLIMHAVPIFLMATVLLFVFSNPELLNWLPASGVAPIQGFNSHGISRLLEQLSYLILPLICYVYGGIALYSNTLSESVKQELHHDYVRTALAKGLSRKKTLYRHALRNAYIPFLTLVLQSLPALLGGSVIIETIFNLPGLGFESYQAIFSQNYPIIIAMLTLTGILTVTSYWVGDILYRWLDPRIH